MGKRKSPTSTSPQVVATLSSLLLLVVSAALGFYFVELRGPGVRTLLAGSQAPELLVLLGGLAAIVLTGHIAVASAARSTQGTQAYRKLVRRAADIDPSDPAVLERFDGVPELRDLVRILVAEKEQGQQLQDALESVRGEAQGLLQGMERSLNDLSRMREEHPSELGRKVSAQWNALLDRVHEAQQQAQKAASIAAPAVETSFESSLITADSHGMEQRLRDLEARVAQLHSSTQRSPEPLLVAEDDDVVDDGVIDIGETIDDTQSMFLSEMDSQQDAAAPFGSFAQETPEVPEPQFEDAVDDVFAGSTDETPFEPQRAPTFAGPWRQAAPAAAPTPGTAEPQEDAVADDAVADDDATQHTYSEWSGAGFGSLTDLTQEADAREVPGMHFPKFGPRQSMDDSDHVEVTYDGSHATKADTDFLSFDVDEEVVDLRSLGAVETRE